MSSGSPDISDQDTPRSATGWPMLRYRMTLAYDGSAFHGWQIQPPNRGVPTRTVQGETQMALMRLLRQTIKLVGASRTDARVHARGQVCHFDAATPIPLDRMLTALRGRLPDDIDVVDLTVADPGFEAIGQVTRKQYTYRIWNRPEKPLTRRHMLYHGAVELDVDRMNDAAGRLVGTHDVAGFAALSHGRKTTVRTIFHCGVVREGGTREEGGGGGEEVVITVSSNGFLYNMVRIIAGTLYEVGRGRFGPERIDEILAAADRRLAGPTLGPEGLCLDWIVYGDPARPDTGC